MLVSGFSNFKRMFLLAVIASIATALGAGLSIVRSSVYKQSSGKSISRKYQNKEPFELVEYRINGNPVKENERLPESEDLIRKLRFVIRNKSEVPIVYVRSMLGFPDTQGDKPMRVYDIEVGHKTNATLHKGNPIHIIKDDVIVFTISDKQYENIGNSLSRAGFSLSNLSKLEIWIQEIHFANGTMWYAGENYVSDPTRPSGWRKAAR